MNAPTNPNNLRSSNNPLDNPLLSSWDLPGQFPPFTAVLAEHFKPAFEQAMLEKRAQLEAIANNTNSPTFENTVASLDLCGPTYGRVGMLFSNLLGSASSDELRAVELQLAPVLAGFDTELFGNAALFARLDGLMNQDRSQLSEEQNELLKRFHLDFLRSGAKLQGTQKVRFGEIAQKLAQLTAQFSQNVLANETAYTLELTDNDVDGLPQFVLDSAAQAAKERNSKSAYVITLSRSLVVPFLMFAKRRDLRKQAFLAWTQRGQTMPEFDNTPIIKEILVLRKEMAQILGYKNFADYALDDRMAGTPAAAKDLVMKAWEPAKKKAARELAQLSDAAKAEGMHEALEPWDWRYYSEKVRAAQYDLSDDECKPFFALGNITHALFDTATQLFGLQFKQLNDAKTYHADVKMYEVHEQSGELVGYFLADNFARPNKQGGAWMSAYRTQAKNGLTRLPIISNNNNFSRAAKPDESLLSLDDVRTLFHEFGHGLHGLLSNVTYDRIGGTNVMQDFVELPSQLFEHWGTDRALLKKHARHVSTGEAISDALIDRIEAAATFNLGFETVEYCSCCLVDLALHQIDNPEQLDIAAFEKQTLDAIGMPREIVMRHRLPHFGHLFSGNYYAAGYYVYLWAEVLDADAFDAFREAGNLFDPATAQRLRKHIYGAGASVAPMKTYLAFRGKQPAVEPMLRDRGLLG